MLGAPRGDSAPEGRETLRGREAPKELYRSREPDPGGVGTSGPVRGTQDRTASLFWSIYQTLTPISSSHQPTPLVTKPARGGGVKGNKGLLRKSNFKEIQF